MSPINAIGTPFIQLNQVDSTNNYAMGQVQVHLAEHGTTWFAWAQNEGRGQRGKTWKAAPGQNLTMSVAVVPAPLSISKQFYLSAAVALACYDLLSKYARSDVYIKWPNDIYWKDRKAGGILIENILQGNDWKYAIVGIGLNINQATFPSDLLNPVSLRQITGQQYELLSIASELCGCLEARWQQLLVNDFEGILNSYNEVLYKKDERVKFKIENAELDARVLGVQATGELLLDTGKPTAFPFGTVEWILT